MQRQGMRTMDSRSLRMAVVAAVWGLLSLMCLAPGAGAELTYQSSFGEAGTGAGQFARPAGVASNNATGDIYVADYNNHRIQQFTEAGTFIRAWGYDVVASGANNKSFVTEVNELKIRATGGTFRLAFEGDSTDPLPYDASASQVEAALNALPAISADGGSVTVTGGPGDATGSTPYVINFDGASLEEEDLALSLDPTGLALPSGTTLTCSAAAPTGASGVEYQWLENGVPIPEATSATFTPGPDQAGAAIQCKAFASYLAGSVKNLGASQPYAIAAGSSAVAPPLGPEQLAQPSSSQPLKVGQSAGATLTCQAGTWTGAPDSYTYRWYRNGTEIAAATSTETSNAYTLTSDDAGVKANFQCSVTGTNSGGASIAFSQFIASDPAPAAFSAPQPHVSVPPNRFSRLITKTNGGPVFEICEANPPSTDVCKAGVAGSSLGQFDLPRSIAVDNSPGGDDAVFVHDENNFRIQKFSAEGERILEFGKEVDETAEADVCTAASGHSCGPGVRAIDESPVAIGYSGPNNFTDHGKEYVDLGNQIAVDQDGHVYLAEIRRAEDVALLTDHGCPNGACGPRVQKWNTDGTFVGIARLPDLEYPVSIGVDSKEIAYVTIANLGRQGFERIYAHEFGPTGGAVQPIGNYFLASQLPRQVAIDPRNDRPLISDINEKDRFGAPEQTSVCGGPRIPGRGVVELDVNMVTIDCSVPQGPGNLTEITGMAVSAQGLLFAAAGNKNVIKVFKLPTPAAPVIGAQAAKKITTQSGELHAQINPGFEETSYRVEYGLGDCEVTACTTVDSGGTLGGLKFADAVVNISGLAPNTTYHYRFIAKNSIGEVKGEDKTFTTYPLVDLVNDPCPNALARKQTTSAGLLDCRAYELVSAAWTGGYDVVSNLVPGQHPYDGYPEAANKVLYGVKDGGIPGTGNPTNRGIDPYVAERDEGGWTTDLSRRPCLTRATI
jgi:NHL repeat